MSERINKLPRMALTLALGIIALLRRDPDLPADRQHPPAQGGEAAGAAGRPKRRLTWNCWKSCATMPLPTGSAPRSTGR